MNSLSLKTKKIVNLEGIIKKYIDSESLENTYTTLIEAKDYISHIYIFEQYFLRIGSYITITLITKEELANTTVEVIASGGGNEFGKLSAYGAEISAIKSVSKYLSQFGFDKVEWLCRETKAFSNKVTQKVAKD